MSSEKRKPRRPADARRRTGKKSQAKGQSAGGGKTGPRNRKAADPEGISTLGKWIMAGGAVLALLLLVGVGFLIRHLVNKSAFEDAVANERWTEVLEYNPTHGKALVNLAKAKLEESPPNVSAVFEYLDRIPSDEPDTDTYFDSASGEKKPLRRTIRANAHAHRAAETADSNLADALVDYDKAVVGSAQIEFLNPARANLVSNLLKRALNACDQEGEDKAAVDQLQQAYTLARTGGTPYSQLTWWRDIKFEGKPDGVIPLRLGFLEFTSKREAYLNSPDAAGLDKFCEDVEKFFVLAASSDKSLFGAGRFGMNRDAKGVIDAQGTFLVSTEGWNARKTQFVARMHDMCATFVESDLSAALKIWRLAERIAPDSTPASLESRFKETLVRNFHDAMKSDRSSGGPSLSLLNEVDQHQSHIELRSIIGSMQSPEELNSLLFDLSKGKGWPAALNGRAADLVSRFEKNKNAQPLIQLIHDTKPIIGGAVPRYLYGRSAVLLWQPNPENAQSAERMLNFLQGQPNKSGLVYRVPPKMVESLREWLAAEANANGASWLRSCRRLYVCGQIAPGKDSFDWAKPVRNSQQRSQPSTGGYAAAQPKQTQTPRSPQPPEPPPHLGTFFVNRIIAAVAPSHPRSDSTTKYALTGRLFTADGHHELVIHDVLLGNSIVKRGHPAMPLLTGQKTSGVPASRSSWPDGYLQRLATAEVRALQDESQRAAEATSIGLLKTGVVGQDYSNKKLTSQQKDNLRKGKRLLTAVRAISDGTSSWLAALNEYKDAFSSLAGEASEEEVTKALEQQWVGVTTPSDVAIVSLADVIPLANKLVTEQKQELEAAKESEGGADNTDGKPSDLRYWPNTTFQDMTSEGPAVSELYAKVLNDTVFAMFEEEDREKKRKENEKASSGRESYSAADAQRERMAKANQEKARRELGLGGSSRSGSANSSVVYYAVVVPSEADLAAGRGSREKRISQAEYDRLSKASKFELLRHGYSRVGMKLE